MALQNTHRSAGRAVTPLRSTSRAARTLGGAALLGTVLAGTALSGGAANANDQELSGSSEQGTTTVQSTQSSQSSELPSSGSSAGSTAAPASSGSSNSIMSAAESALGTPYSWGGDDLGGMDCSGLVTYAYQQAGIDIPRTSSEIAAQGTSISESEAQPGDIVTYPGHVAIYAGNGKIIDASGSQQKVVERDIWGSPSGFVTFR
ncbi:hydrolase [Brachybacterium endophyticum]|uniref:Hydrolase n=1 Tax=Brachybacterium endophyticum TaxID=2182385 RepID=A0A2U2RP05_9MICO|nr:C40 family peptidase [Brachybacterium endophyticum]PWH07613.1 hydrolase [Brachybacterium endophyticum]